MSLSRRLPEKAAPAGPETFPACRTAPGEPEQYFGGDLQSYRDEQGLRFSEVTYRREVRWAGHTHLRAFFALLLRGQYTEEFPRGRLTYRPFDVAFHPEATQHVDRIEAAASRFFLVEVEEPWLQRLRECFPAAGREPRMCDASLAPLLLRLYREHRAGVLNTRGQRGDRVLELLAGLAPGPSRPSHEPPPWLRTVLELIRSEYPDRLSLDDIARQVRLHPVYLSRTFRQYTGQNMSRCLVRSRIRFAIRKLAETDLPLAEVALAAGFCDQSHFTRVFKRETGKTPAAARAETRWAGSAADPAKGPSASQA